MVGVKSSRLIISHIVAEKKEQYLVFCACCGHGLDWLMVQRL